MPIITTIQEFRSQLPRLLSSLSDTAVMPNMLKAQRKYLQPLMGFELLNNLQGMYRDMVGTPLVAPYIELLAYAQQPLAAYAMLDDLAFSHVMITDAGIRTVSTDKMQAAHRWEYLEIKNALQDYAIDGVENLLQFMYENKADLPVWTASPEYKNCADLVIKTGKDFSLQYPLYAPMYTYYSLQPIMRDVEENYLVSMYGRDLLAWIKTQTVLEITVPGNGVVDVLKLVKKAVAFLTIKHACEHYSPRFDKNGFTILASGNTDDNSSTGNTAASIADLQLKKQACDRDGQNYLAKSAAFLVGVAAGEFSSDFGSDFSTAFEGSPLKPVPNAEPYTNGNERRNIFRF